jgi:hypothetical protein
MLTRRGPRRVVLAIGLIALSAGITVPVLAQSNDDPLTASTFSIQVGNQEVARFDHLVDLTRTLHGEPALELVGPYTSDRYVENWLQGVQRGPSTGRNFVLTAYSTEGAPVAKYSFVKGVPETVHVEGSKAGASDILNLRVRFTAERVTRIPVP